MRKVGTKVFSGSEKKMKYLKEKSAFHLNVLCHWFGSKRFNSFGRWFVLSQYNNCLSCFWRYRFLLFTIYSSHLYFSRCVETQVYVLCALYSVLFHCRCIFKCFDEKTNGADNDDVLIEISLGIYVSFEVEKLIQK